MLKYFLILSPICGDILVCKKQNKIKRINFQGVFFQFKETASTNSTGPTIYGLTHFCVKVPDFEDSPGDF